MNYKILGDNIRMARKTKNLTQEKLAEYIDVSTVFISQIENGIGKPSLETMSKLSYILKIPIDDFLKNSVEYNTPSKNYDEIILLLSNRSTAEINFAISTLKDILKNLHILKDTDNQKNKSQF